MKFIIGFIKEYWQIIIWTVWCMSNGFLPFGTLGKVLAIIIPGFAYIAFIIWSEIKAIDKRIEQQFKNRYK